MSGDRNKLVCLGDSSGSNYKLNVRSNTFSELLARRLGLEVMNYSVPGATTGYQCVFLRDNEELIDAVRDAKVVVLACGANNILQTGLEHMGRAVGIDVNSWRVLPHVLDALKNPVKAVKMASALNSKEARREVGDGVEAFRRDLPALIDRIHELNSDAIIVAMNIYTMSDLSNSPVYKVITKPQSAYTDEMNSFMKEYLPGEGVILADVAAELRAYKGDEELSHLKDGDVHLTDAGHLFMYNCLYDIISKAHPELAREEGPDVIHVRKRRTREERLAAKAAAQSEDSLRLRELTERVINRDDLDYEDDKQYVDMGLTPMAVVDIAKAVEKEFFDGRELLELPAYDYPATLRPRFFLDYLEGKDIPSVKGHAADLPHYGSAEEKQEAESSDSDVMKILKKHIYAYLEDDMVRLDRDTSYFGTLRMNYSDWYQSMYPAEVELNMRFDPARSPSPETVTLGEIEDYVR